MCAQRRVCRGQGTRAALIWDHTAPTGGRGPSQACKLGSLTVKVASPACLPRTGWTADALTANRADRRSSPSRNAYEVAKAETG